MANMRPLAWGKPSIKVCKLLANGDPDGRWLSVPSPVENSTKLKPSKGSKTEAKTEGGEVEAVRHGKNTYELEFEVRLGRGDSPFVTDSDGIIDGLYAVMVQPEDPTVPGIRIDCSTLSAELSFGAEDGTKKKYLASVMTPKAGDAVKVEVINFGATNNLIVILQNDGGAGAWRLQGESNWRASGERAYIAGTGQKTIEYLDVSGKTKPTTTTHSVTAGDNAVVAKYT